MPPVMRGFVTFMSIAFVSTLALTLVQQVHPLGRLWMRLFFCSAAFAMLTGWRVYKRAS